MSRRPVLFLLNTCLLIAILLAPSLASAAPPGPTSATPALPPAIATAPGVTPEMLANTRVKADRIVTEAATRGKELRASLSPDQQKAMAVLMQKYEPELQAVSRSLPQPPNLSGLSKMPAASPEQALQAVQSVTKVNALLTELQGKIDRELQAILSPHQWTQFQAGLAPQRKTMADISSRLSLSMPGGATNGAVTPALATTACYNAGLYASTSNYYGLLAYTYAYYLYYYYGYSSPYIYLDYGTDYTIAGLLYIGAGYFDAVVVGSDYMGAIANAVTAHYNGMTYAAYGYQSAYSVYTSRGYTYAYYAYLYGTSMYLYAYYAYSYDYTCLHS